MASLAPDFGRASALPLSAVLASIPSYPRPVIERLVASLIDHLDEEDGDPDLEDDDPAGGSADDEGEPSAYRLPPCIYGEDQRVIMGRFGPAWRHE